MSYSYRHFSEAFRATTLTLPCSAFTGLSLFTAFFLFFLLPMGLQASTQAAQATSAALTPTPPSNGGSPQNKTSLHQSTNPKRMGIPNNPNIGKREALTPNQPTPKPPYHATWGSAPPSGSQLSSNSPSGAISGIANNPAFQKSQLALSQQQNPNTAQQQSTLLPKGAKGGIQGLQGVQNASALNASNIQKRLSSLNKFNNKKPAPTSIAFNRLAQGLSQSTGANQDNDPQKEKDAQNNKDDSVTIDFPHASILEILSLYEQLTGKHIIRDANLEGPELNLSVAKPVSKKEAISLLESSMLLNGYALVPLDNNSVKILGPSHPARAEGIPLYLDETQLPVNGEQLISFYKPLHFITPGDAISVLKGVIEINPYGSLVAVPNTSAIVLTDKTPVIQKALALLRVIDHEPSQIITEFITLKRANAEKTVETLNQIIGKDTSNNSNAAGNPNNPAQPPGVPGMGDQGGLVDGGSGVDEKMVTGKVQFIPDKRTNRILLITRSDNYQYLRKLISNLDEATPVEKPLERTLNYMSVTDIFPVLTNMLKEKDDDSKDDANNNNNSKSSSTPEPTPNSSSDTNNNSPMGGTGSNNGATNSADKLGNATQPQPPQSAIIGSTKLIGDPTANTITVYGPPENKEKANQIIDLLDQKPKQVYLAAVIGTLKLDKNTNYGTDYLFNYQGFNYFAGGQQAALPGLTELPKNIASASSALGGLTLVGAISGSVSAYAQFLESTGKFRTIGRPVVYTSNNRKATIYSGQKVPYNSSTLSSVVAGSTVNDTANSFTSNVTYQDVLLKLEVIPLVNSDREINLTIAQQNQTLDTTATAANTIKKIDAPTINTQELTTTVRVSSGSTIVLGGLIQEDQTDEKNGIPYLSQIPLIGGLLGGYQTRQKTRSELVIMIQPIIVDSNAEVQHASNIEGGSSDIGITSKNAVNLLKPTPTPTPTPKPKGFHPFGIGLKKPPKQNWSFNTTQF